MLDREIEDGRIHQPPDPGVCPWCRREWASDEDDLPTCCPKGRRYVELERAHR